MAPLGLLPIVVLLASQGLPDPAMFSNIPGGVVLVAGWLVRGRLLLIVFAIAWGTQFLYLGLGELVPLQATVRGLAFAGIAFTCRLGLHGLLSLRQARQHDLSTILIASRAMSGPLDLEHVAIEAVRAAARTVDRRGRPGGRPAAMLCVSEEAVTLVAACDAAGVEVADAAAGTPLGAVSPAVLRALADGHPGVVQANEIPAGLAEVTGADAGAAWALAWVPVGGEAFGVLTVPHPGEVDRDELRLLDGIARVAGLAIATALERAELGELQRRLQHSVELALGAGRSLEPADVLARTLVKVAQVMDADRATIARLEDAELVVETTHWTGGGEPVPDGRRFPADLVAAVPCLARAVASERPAVAGPLEADASGADLAAALGDGRHTLVYPMVIAAGMTCLLVLARHRDKPFAADDLTRLEPLGDVAVLVLRNAYLYASAERARLDARSYSVRLQLAIEAAEDIGSSPELSEVLEGVLRRAVAVARADRGTISRADADDRMVVEYVHDPSGTEPRAGATWLLTEHPLADQAVRGGQPIQGGRDAGSTCHVMACPLMLGRQVVGILELGRMWTPFDEADRLSLQPFATLAALLLRYARLLAEARQVGQAKSSFLNLAAHELRTPLAVIKGYVSMLEDGTFADPKEIREVVVSTLVEKTQELEALVEALLTTAKLDVGAVPRALSELDVADIVQAALDRVAPRARIEGATIEAQVPDRGLHVLADEGHLARILDNLLNNALTYSGQPAEVTVEVRSGDGVEIAVRDHGMGIPADEHGRVFERFHRIDGQRSRFSPGLGLGLSISRELAQINDGSLRLEDSVPGLGSTFVLRLPLTGS